LLLALLGAGCGSEGSPAGEVAEAYTQQCPDMDVEGVDVYAGTGTVDWAKLAAAGRVFAFIKATQGDYNTQSTFNTNWANSKANGILRSPYHFFDPTIDGVMQANWFLAELAQAGGLEPGDLPPMLDLECPVSSDQATAEAKAPSCEHSGDSGWEPTATLIQRTFDWLNTVEAALGRKAIIYSYVSWFSSVGFTDTKLAEYPLFIASYNSCPSVPAPWTSATFWQYSGTGSVSGIAGNADLDRFLGTLTELNAFISATIELQDAGSDLAPPPPDLAPLPDLARPADLGRDGGSRSDVQGGCACQMGGADSIGGWWLGLLLLMAAFRRFKMRLAPTSSATNTLTKRFVK
jgi:lysozyme